LEIFGECSGVALQRSSALGGFSSFYEALAELARHWHGHQRLLTISIHRIERPLKAHERGFTCSYCPSIHIIGHTNLKRNWFRREPGFSSIRCKNMQHISSAQLNVQCTVLEADNTHVAEETIQAFETA